MLCIQLLRQQTFPLKTLSLCYYPTETGVMHSAFNKDPYAMKKLIDFCHEGGIDVIAYYSINYNTLESKRHPEWAMVKEGGQANSPHMFSGDRYGLCCPNNPDYLQFMLDQTTEILEFADFDGIFYDMPFWSHICYCGHCKRKYKEEFGVKAKMITFENVEEVIGHAAGGVCPFGINDNVNVYLDESLKIYEYIYPACGSHNSAVKLTIKELEESSNYIKWVNVCK